MSELEERRREGFAALSAVAWTAYGEAYQQDGLGGKQAMERAVQAVLKWLGDRPYHVIEYGEDKFVIQHPLTCRPNLLACPASQAGVHEDDVPDELGRYAVTVVDGRLVRGDKEV